MTTDDKLILLMEECGEVILAASKCLRFGYTRDQPGYGRNDEALSKEVGDMLGVIDALPLNEELVSIFRRNKMPKANNWFKEIGLTYVPQEATPDEH